MILLDFECDEGHVTEHFINSDTSSTPCPVCGSPSHRVFLTPPHLDWTGLAMGENAGPEFVDRWAKRREKETKRQEKCFEEHGDYGPGYASPPSTNQGT